MSQNKEEIKEYAEGWITERKGTDVPTFLRFAYIIIAGGCAAYLVLYMNGETGHAERGPLVQAFNKVSQSANGLMYCIAALVVVYAIIVVGFAFKKFRED
ncbi:MAG: hypothetical protein HYR56_05795 [Acidobacteria bacterium]|nr:hypothetical protein [Acidobacteriota bacterium]MBI3424727.1 hypothetical protein [Acidobacteriota bacterium]